MKQPDRNPSPDPHDAIGSAGPPAAVRYLRFLTDPVERLLDRIYGSKWNPFYQSGNLAVLSFLVSLASGLVLFLWYHISDPHGSVLAIQQSLPGGAWLRSLHRYSADLAVVAIAAHLLRKLLQGHTWGPRTLAWISGVVLLLRHPAVRLDRSRHGLGRSGSGDRHRRRPAARPPADLLGADQPLVQR